MERIQIENKTTIRGETNNKVVSGEIRLKSQKGKNEILNRIENCIVDKSTMYFFK